MRIERRIEVAAPPEALYAVIMDATRLDDWVTIHDALESAPRGMLRKGSELVQRLRLAGQPFTVHWTVIENRPAERVVWEGRGPMRSKARVTYELERTEIGTLFSYANEYALPGGPLGRMAGPVVKRVTTGELENSLQRLRALVE